MLIRSVLIWFVLLLLAVLNGGFREAVLLPRLGRGLAQAVSTVILSALILTLGWIATPWMAPRTLQDAWTIGVTWVALTLAFEFLAGHFVFGKTWEVLFADYNLFAGRIWVAVLIVTLMTPVVAFTSAGGEVGGRHCQPRGTGLARILHAAHCGPDGVRARQLPQSRGELQAAGKVTVRPFWDKWRTARQAFAFA